MTFDASRQLAVALALALGVLPSCTNWSADDPTPPTFRNLIIIMIDTLRSDRLPCYGSERQTAPTISRLASTGTQLQGYAASSWTRSSVASLLTGLHPQRHQVIGRKDGLGVMTPYLPEILNQAGYQTVAFVTNGNVSQPFGFDRGYRDFELVLGDLKPDANEIVEDILDLTNALTSPYYLYIHLIDPHSPYIPHAPWGGEPTRIRDYPQPETLNKTKAQLSEELLQQLRDQYDGEILEMDKAIGRLVSGLKRRGLLEEALLVLTSDHGEEFGEHGGLAHGSTLYEEVLRVPMIFWSEEKLPSWQSDSPFHHVDFVPTVLEALGLPDQPNLDGTSRWKTISRREYRGPDEMLFHLDLDGVSALALTKMPHKLVRSETDRKLELFHIENDPTERIHLDSHEANQQHLAKRLQFWQDSLLGAKFEGTESQLTHDIKEQLEALGYLDDS